MEIDMKKAWKVCAVGVAALLVGGLGGAAFFPVEKEVIKEVPVDVIHTETVTEFVDVPVEVEVEVEVDNDNLAIVLDEIFDNGGNVEYLVDGLDDDELDQIVDRVKFIGEAKAMAIQEVESEAFDELDGENYPGRDKEFDEDDLSHLDVEDDPEELRVEHVDYDDMDCFVYVPFEFEDDQDREFEAVARVRIKDGEVHSMDVRDISREQD